MTLPKLPISVGSTSDVPETFPMGETSPNADRDTAFDHDPAAVGPARPAAPTEPTESEKQAEADVAAAIEANAPGIPVNPMALVHDPTQDLEGTS